MIICTVSTYAESKEPGGNHPTEAVEQSQNVAITKPDIFIMSITTVFLRFDSLCLDRSPATDVND